jgi:hypothetical protein
MKYVLAPLVMAMLVSSAFLSQPAPSAEREEAAGNANDPAYFPIGVWLQNPRNARRYQAAGINLYVGLWQGPTNEQLDALKAAGMRVICSQNEVGLSRRDDGTIFAWMHQDEPDNAQPMRDPVTGRQTWGPPVPPAKIVADYERMRQTDPTRPVFLNLGQGVANDEWVGRGPNAKLEDYHTYVKGADIVSFDVYPIADLRREDGENYLWYVAKGVSRLRQWTDNGKPVWNIIEAAKINSPRRATPHQVRAQVWMSLIHGSTGIVYFVHQFKPTFNEHALLDDLELLPAVTAINRQVQTLAPVLNSPSIEDGVAVESSSPDMPIAAVVKRFEGATYLFAVGMRNGAARGTFTVRGVPARAKAEVIGEGRTIPVRDGTFTDQFDAYDVRLYGIR